MDFEEREAILRASVDAWNSVDWEAELKALWDPEGSIVAPEGWPEAGTFSGWEAMVGEWRRIKDSWADEHVELVSARPAGEGALGEVHWELRGEASGAPLEVRAWIVCRFKGPRLVEMRYLLDEASARAAAAELES